MFRLWTAAVALLVTVSGCLHAQGPAAAARGEVTLARQMSRVTLVQVNCPENKLTMDIWLAPGLKAPWLKKGARVNIVPTGEGQEVRFSPGRLPRSDYTRPQPVRVLISSGSGVKVSGTVVSLTFH